MIILVKVIDITSASTYRRQNNFLLMKIIQQRMIVIMLCWRKMQEKEDWQRYKTGAMACLISVYTNWYLLAYTYKYS